ncbi:LptA/OstA family protein [Oricola sp.]|uniref:LptA/OstA family protein n=1 Tax=Oricola sp. TaxID=1979950 RepID=UPI0025F6FC03|nr:LptA/OstA family protein [Oricola sp.]MCI5077903.1 LPS ABC transporter substrate-binding protein LptA [Oricola sp.]
MRMTSFSRQAAYAALMALLVVGGPALAQNRTTGLRLDSNRPVQIEGDQLEVLEDQGKAVFNGNVRVAQDKTVLRTGRLVIHYASGGSGGSITSSASKIEKLEATGGVNIQNGTQVATGDTGVFDMRTEVLVLSGKRVTLSEGGNVATGCKLTVSMKDGRAKLQGCGDSGSRPTILLQPQSSGN